MKKKIRICSEAVYVLAVVTLSFATAMLAAADLGLSMVVAPAYIVSLKVPFLTFGQAEYVTQGVVFLLFCVLMRKIKPLYFCSFLSGFIYGLVLDFWRMAVPHFNPEVCAPGSLPLSLRLVYFVVGFFINSLGVTLYFKTYFYPQVYEFFVKGISGRFGIELSRFKIGYDIVSLIVAVILSMALLGRIKGIGPGTVVLACLNGLLIGFYGRVFDRYVDTYPMWKGLAERFEL